LTGYEPAHNSLEVEVAMGLEIVLQAVAAVNIWYYRDVHVRGSTKAEKTN